jgi:hypothetical protein
MKPSSMAAYECVLAAKVLHHRSTREDNTEALKLIDRALTLDPDYAHAHAWRGCILPKLGLRLARTRMPFWRGCWLDKAMALDDNDADVHRILAAVAIARNDMNRALSPGSGAGAQSQQRSARFRWASFSPPLGRAGGNGLICVHALESSPSCTLLGATSQGAFRRPAVCPGHRGVHAIIDLDYTTARCRSATLGSATDGCNSACVALEGTRSELICRSSSRRCEYANEADLQHLRDALASWMSEG